MVILVFGLTSTTAAVFTGTLSAGLTIA
jgi:hypothetical protein